MKKAFRGLTAVGAAASPSSGVPTGAGGKTLGLPAATSGLCPMLLTLFDSQFGWPLSKSVTFVFGLGIVGSWEVAARTGLDEVFCDSRQQQG